MGERLDTYAQAAWEFKRASLEYKEIRSVLENLFGDREYLNARSLLCKIEWPITADGNGEKAEMLLTIEKQRPDVSIETDTFKVTLSTPESENIRKELWSESVPKQTTVTYMNHIAEDGTLKELVDLIKIKKIEVNDFETIKNSPVREIGLPAGNLVVEN